MFRFGDPGGRIYGAVGASNVNLLALWTGFGGSQAGQTWSVQASGGRLTGNSSLRLATPGSNLTSTLTKTLDNQATWGIAFAFKTAALPSVAVALVAWQEGGTTQVDLRHNLDGTLQVTRNGTVLATSSNALAAGSYYHIEFKTKIDPSAGTYEVRVNGSSTGWIAPATGQNTRATSNSWANVLAIGKGTGTNGGVNFDFDDLIVWDAQTTDANGFTDISDFIGDCGLLWLLPSAAGTTTQFTPDSGSNYARVNEATPDGDTSYVGSNTVGQIDTYSLGDLPLTATAVKTVAQVHYVRKDDLGPRGIKAELRSSGGNAAHATEAALGTSYIYTFSNWGRNPNNGSPIAWTPAAVNTLEAGQQISS